MNYKERVQFKRVVIITGTPGVGKTVVSKQLAVRLHAFHVNLTELVKHEGLTSGYDRTRGTLIVDTDKLTKRVQQIIEEHEGKTIIDGHYALDVVQKTEVSKVFVLRRHPEQLKEQLENRRFKGAKLWENLAAEILDVCLYDAIMNVGVEKVCEVDTTNKTVDEVVNEILSVLGGKKECNAGMIDWLGTLERENSLDRYLKHF